MLPRNVVAVATRRLQPALKSMNALNRRCLSAAAEGGSDFLQIADPPGMRVVDLHRPAALNALNGEMVSTLLPLFQDWQRVDGDVQLVVLRGSGGRAFCAGGDIRFLHERASAFTKTQDVVELDGAHQFFREEYALNHCIGTSRVPVVSIIDGIVMGGGVGLSVHGHLRIATESTVFAMPETGIGFFPDVGGTWFLPRLPGKLGLYLGLTGARLRGRDTVTAGVATHFVASERVEAVEALLLEFAQRTTGKTHTLESNQNFVDVGVLHEAVRAVESLAAPPAAAEEEVAAPLLTAATLSEIDECFGGTDVWRIVETVADLAAERGGGHWAVQAAKELQRASPTSLAVTFEALRRGHECSSLAACLQMEFCIAQRFIKHPDFRIGVGAVLSKGEKPAVWAAPPGADQLEEWFVAGDGGTLSLEENAGRRV
mmetsp:Transcript_36268/g.77342  ORF Transcript_36268/g.77342 Transcript_36268/m.77342 type:complete len:429 (-) Transcript_36268:348-1634(-)